MQIICLKGYFASVNTIHSAFDLYSTVPLSQSDCYFDSIYLKSNALWMVGAVRVGRKESHPRHYDVEV